MRSTDRSVGRPAGPITPRKSAVVRTNDNTSVDAPPLIFITSRERGRIKRRGSKRFYVFASPRFTFRPTSRISRISLFRRRTVQARALCKAYREEFIHINYRGFIQKIFFIHFCKISPCVNFGQLNQRQFSRLCRILF